VYVWAIDHAGNISLPVSQSIIYDTTAPSFTLDTAKTILIQATGSYVYTLVSPNGGPSNIRDFSIDWNDPSMPSNNTGAIDLPPPLTYDF
jgi:hypothetical protein